MSLTMPGLPSTVSCVTFSQSPPLQSKPGLRRRVKLPAAVAGTGGEVVGDVGVLLQLLDPWSPIEGSQLSLNSESITSQLFAGSLFPYLGFLYYISRSNSTPKLTLFGFYFLLAFVAATIPAGIYAKLRYGTSLANVDWLHGGAESLLTLTNLFIVLGLRKAVRENAHIDGNETSASESDSLEETVMRK